MKNKILGFVKNVFASLLLLVVALLLVVTISISGIVVGIIAIPALIFGFCKRKEQWISNKQ